MFSYYQAMLTQLHDLKWILLKVQHTYTRVYKMRTLYKYQEHLQDIKTSQSFELQGQMTIKSHHKLWNTSTMPTQAMILFYESKIISYIISSLLSLSQTSLEAYKSLSCKIVYNYLETTVLLLLQTYLIYVGAYMYL